MTPKPIIRNIFSRCLGLLALAALGACSMFGGASRAPAAATVQGQGQAPGEVIDLAKVRADLSQLEADPQLALRVPEAIREAEEAVGEAQAARGAGDRYLHLAYIADRKEQTARALAESKVAEDQLKDLRGQ